MRVLTRGVERDGERARRTGRRAVGRRWSRAAWRRGCRASSACPGSPARRARRRSRTSAPTGRTSPRPSRGCASMTARRTRVEVLDAAASAASTTAAACSSTATAGRCSPSRFRLRASALSGPLRYAELARTLGRARRRRARRSPRCARPCSSLRRGKGMVVDPADPDSVSAGSFFTNPILTAEGYAALAARAGSSPPAFAGARRAHQDVGRVADRARRLRPRARRRAAPASRPSTRSRSSTAAARRRPS